MRFLSSCFVVLVVAAAALRAQPAQAAVFYPEIFTLANGMQVVVVQNRLSPAAAQMVWYKVGAADDPVGRSGLAHYLEHMMFKGTENLPSGQFSSLIAAQGGDENAYTTHDTTAYHETVTADRLAMVMQMEADRMRSLRFDRAEAASELAVVLSERQERTDNQPQGRFAEAMSAALYGTHPYGRPVIGWRQDIENISPEDAQAFYKKYYAPDNAILVVSGNVETKDVLRLAAATFGRIQPDGARPPRKPRPLPFSSSRGTPAQRVEEQDARVTQAVSVQRILLPRIAADSRASLALDVLAEILSSGEVGLLHRHFVMETRQASAVSASYSSTTRGPVSFAVTAVPAPAQDVRVLEKEVGTYLHRLARTGVRQEDVRAAKRRLEDSAVFARDRLMAPSEILGATLASGQTIESVESWPERIRSVRTHEVNAVLRAVLAAPDRVTGVLEGVPSAAGEEAP